MASTVQAKTLPIKNASKSETTSEKKEFDPNYKVLTPEVLQQKIDAQGGRTDFNGFKLPTHSELDYPDITISSAALKAGAFHLGKYCLNESREFMLCKHEERDPRKCLSEGHAVTRCGLEFFHALKTHCYKEFEDHWRCIHHSGRRMDFTFCRKSQQVYDKCVLEKMGIERPDVGYYTKAHEHETDRPKPKIQRKVFPNPPKGMPKEYDTPPTFRGNRSPVGL